MAIEHIITVPADPVEAAVRVFGDQVKQLPGVVKVLRDADGGNRRPGVIVVVDDIFTDVTRNVFRLYHALNAAVPGVGFELDVKDQSTALEVAS